MNIPPVATLDPVLTFPLGVPDSEKEERLEPFIQKLFKVQIITQISLKKTNCIWLNPNDFIALFGKTDKNTPRFVQIANQVYRAVQGTLSKGWIAISDNQKDSFYEALFNTNAQPKLVAIPFDPHKEVTYPIKKIEIDIEDQKNISNGVEPIILTIDTLKEKFAAALKEDFLCLRKSVLIGMPWGMIKGKVTALFPAKRLDTTSIAGKINRKTEIKFISRVSKDIVLVNQIYQEEIERFDFSISFVKHPNSHHNSTLAMNEDAFIEQIKEKIKGRVLLEGSFTLFSQSLRGDIYVELAHVELKKTELERTPHPSDFKKGYIYHPGALIKLQCTNEILLWSGSPLDATQIVFSVAGNPTVIYLDELKKSLYEMKKNFMVNETFPISLSSGSFLIKVKKTLPCSPLNQKPLSWRMSPETQIDVVADKDMYLNIIQDQRVHEIKKAVIKISAEDFEEDIHITVKDLKELVLTQAPSRLFSHHRFSVQTINGKRVELKLLHAHYPSNLNIKKPETVCGFLTDKTEFDFSVEICHPIVLLDTIYTHEIAKLRFALKALKVAGTHCARSPLVIDRKEFEKKIREEIAQHPYILIGYTFHIPLDNGWEIKLTLRKGTLHPQFGALKVEALFSQTQQAYAPTALAEIELVGNTELIIFTQGEPTPASRMDLMLIEVFEDQNEGESLKETWINLEEVKNKLVKMNKIFAQREHIIISLETGQYLFEVEFARPKNPFKKLPKERSEIRWTIDNDTKIHAKTPLAKNLKVVNTASIYPLKKIKFFAFSEDNASPLLSLKESKLKQALLETLPERLIKGQILTLKIHGHSVKMDVDEVTLEDETLNLDMRKTFVSVTDQTEIVIRGLEKNPISVSSEPQILQVDDPIQYLEHLGLGGVDKEFKQILRVLFSRSDRLSEEAQRRGTKPISGILLYGPPGTGKTALARRIGEMLGCSGERIQMLTATEIFNKWFGKSEENIRAIFAPARKAQEKLGKKSPVYVVVFDEIDALLTPRGGSTTQIRDSLVNQFLGEIGGLKELNNLLVIGVTNRKDEIDPAALRHGRLGVHIEVGLPDYTSRIKILEIHTRKLSKENLLGKDVDLKTLAQKTDKFPGAALEGIVESASLFSLERLNKLKISKEEMRNHPAGIVVMKDFEQAIKEIQTENPLSESIRLIWS